MPELAEVEHARRLFDVGLGQRIDEVRIATPLARVFRGASVAELSAALVGQRFVSSQARGKQLALRFGKPDNRWLGLHLGMAGRLRVEAAAYAPRKHDHLVLYQKRQALVFHDPRHFGRVQFFQGAGEPPWWLSLAPSVGDASFSAEAVAAYLSRRRRAPLKTVLLTQALFSGVGNWMADEILWRAGLHPITPAGALSPEQARTVWQSTRHVAQEAIDVINDQWEYPLTWLFAHRWKDGGTCPRCRTSLVRAPVGGRTTCWCPRCQPASA